MTTQTPDIDAVLGRLDRLEKENRCGEVPTTCGPRRVQGREKLIALVSTGLAAGAFVLSAAAFGWSYFHDPLGKGLKQYDLSTPKASLLAVMRIYADQDLRAMIELQQLSEGKQPREALKT